MHLQICQTSSALPLLYTHCHPERDRKMLMDSLFRRISKLFCLILPGKCDFFLFYFPSPPLSSLMVVVSQLLEKERSSQSVSLGATRRNKTGVNTKQDRFKSLYVCAAISDLFSVSNPSLRPPLLPLSFEITCSITSSRSHLSIGLLK